MAALTIVGMAGMVLDLGAVYLAKTRLHNALDAAAIAGANTLFQTGNENTAGTAATTVFNTNVAKISGASGVAQVQFATTLTGTYTSASAVVPSDKHFVKVTVASLPVSTHLIGVFGFSSMPIGGTATAGPEGLSGGCGAIPLALCGSDNGDTNCTDGNGCFGIAPDPLSPNQEVSIKPPPGSAWSPGNYGYVAISSGGPGGGGSAIRDGMAGGKDTCFTINANIDVQTGGLAGPGDGLNTRFEDQHQGWASGYKPDKVSPLLLVKAPFPLPTQSFSAYELAMGNGVYDNPNGIAKRRVALSPVLDCSTMPNGSSGTAKVIGTACLFLTREIGNDNNIYAQYISSDECVVEGGTPTSGSGASGVRIVLYN